ncbi:MAG: hypothetical protein ACREFY_06375 [Acetobacteraceae bacterium]
MAVIFRHLFGANSGTRLLACRRGRKALFIDPAPQKVDRHLRLIAAFDLNPVKAVDTHRHADHITALVLWPFQKMSACVRVPA